MCTTDAITDHPALRAAVSAALDAGVFYQDEFNRACRAEWDRALPMVDNELPELVIDRAATTYAERKETYRSARDAVLQGERGTWRVVTENDPDGFVYRTAMMNDGYGGVHERGDGWQKKPTFAEMADRLVSCEVYDLRKREEDKRKREGDVALLAATGWDEGTVLKDIRLGGVNYSSARVVRAYRASGKVDLFLTKRGSPKRYEAKDVRATQVRTKGSPAGAGEGLVRNILVNGKPMAA